MKYAIAFAILALVVVGCSRYRGQRSARQYAEQIERSNHRLTHLNRALSRFNERTRKAAEAKLYLKDDVFPRFESYLDTLKAIACDDPELQGIHKLLVDEHSQLFDALKHFDEGLDDKNLAQRIKELKAVVRRTRSAQTEYQVKVRAYYAKYGLKTEK
ncbi:MAG: hypothetical protein KC609_19545 [Myxococcales bacterium]|nr:hypothetical protein [Myxococcales bacterium]